MMNLNHIMLIKHSPHTGPGSTNRIELETNTGHLDRRRGAHGLGEHGRDSGAHLAAVGELDGGEAENGSAAPLPNGSAAEGGGKKAAPPPPACIGGGSAAPGEAPV